MVRNQITFEPWSVWFPTWFDTNQAVQLQKLARGLKFRILKVEGSYYLCSENKGADQLRGYREADLRLCLYAKCWFSHDAAHLVLPQMGECELLIARSQDDPHPGRDVVSLSKTLHSHCLVLVKPRKPSQYV